MRYCDLSKYRDDLIMANPSFHHQLRHGGKAGQSQNRQGQGKTRHHVVYTCADLSRIRESEYGMHTLTTQRLDDSTTLQLDDSRDPGCASLSTRLNECRVCLSRINIRPHTRVHLQTPTITSSSTSSPSRCS